MGVRTLESKKGSGNTLTIGGVNEETGEKNPVSIEGFYMGSRIVTTSNGDATVHVFKTMTGEQSVWGKSDLNNKLAGAEVGEFVTVKYQGKEATKFGKKYVYTVTADSDKRMPLAADEDADDAFADDDGAEEVPPPTPKASNKARVDALLAKKN